jgi:hypothetical protein
MPGRVGARREGQISRSQLPGKVARFLEDVPAVAYDRAPHAQEAGEANGVQRGPGGEVRVEVPRAVRAQAAGDRSQDAQRQHRLLGPPGTPVGEVAKAAQRVAQHEPDQRCQTRTPAVLEGIGDVEAPQRLRVGLDGAFAGLDAHRMAQGPQRLELGGNERLRQRGKALHEHGDRTTRRDHGGATVAVSSRPELRRP